MPDWEVFKRQRYAPDAEPSITVHRRGTIALNAQAWTSLDSPEAVELLFDRATNTMGIRAIDPDEPHAYRLRRNGNSTTSFVLSGTAFFQFYGIDISQAQRYRARIENDVLVIDLSDGTVPSRTSAKATQKHFPEPLTDS